MRTDRSTADIGNWESHRLFRRNVELESKAQSGRIAKIMGEEIAGHESQDGVKIREKAFDKRLFFSINQKTIIGIIQDFF